MLVAGDGVLDPKIGHGISPNSLLLFSQIFSPPQHTKHALGM